MQRSIISAVAAAAFWAALGAGAARASSTSFRLEPVAVANQHGVPGATAIADDPALANRVLNTLMVSVPAGHDWTNSEIRITLATGTIYNAFSTPSVDAVTDPDPSLWAQPGRRHGAYDSFVNAKPGADGRVRPAVLLGALDPDFSGGPPPAIGLRGSHSTVASVMWGSTAPEDGTFQIGQFTLSADATGTYFGRTYATDEPGDFHVFQGTIVGGFIPEPSGLAWLLLPGLGLLRRRRLAATLH